MMKLLINHWEVGRIYSIQGGGGQKEGKGYFQNSGGSWLKGEFKNSGGFGPWMKLCLLSTGGINY